MPTIQTTVEEKFKGCKRLQHCSMLPRGRIVFRAIRLGCSYLKHYSWASIEQP